MENSCVLFDDWATRHVLAFSRRKKEYFFVLICTSVLLVISIVGIFFEQNMFVAFVIALGAHTSVILEWLKVKNNHLTIKKNQIEITNRFNKTVIYQVDINNLSVEIRHAFDRRSGGIIMRFYDSKSNLICKYEDMLNRAAPFGFEQTDWEKGLAALNVQINDPEGIIKNE